ncbi:tetraacyldisaccharide 4'-kinase [Psychroflexus sp. ALD_RP9]|uniref:tetraacyldisaccharide 4'-kinase n=1 Tax=Psychroflexus sp. ALD_RP9 TaxID=2777186 RepID=UPI001A8CE99A|nr:tetraacyldisaccharide 4'-kinase [Psychroflexus sp. ALD_RP9]QSS96961.1 tetraacyldisaccharide 4'-kinase [Psychroflexus sp. ALD_RP9]
MKHLRLLLFPFSLIYGLIVFIRHKLYDYGIKTSTQFDLPVICIGNLSFGGTGKSPLIADIVSQFSTEYNMASLSRGYKRSTRGFRLVEVNDVASSVGDEPLQFKSTFDDQLTVAVCENRVIGVLNILKLKPKTDLILLDDAFQHRKINPGLSILLTTYKDLYIDDYLLPVGNLRDAKYAANRADMIIVTKCPESLSSNEQKIISNKLKLNPNQSLYFSAINYSKAIYSITSVIDLSDFDDFILVTGIANPKPLVEFLKSQGKKFKHHEFADHHNFNLAEINQLKSYKKPILTTTKDFMRLKLNFDDKGLYHLPIQSQIIQKEKQFYNELRQFIDSF